MSAIGLEIRNRLREGALIGLHVIAYRSNVATEISKKYGVETRHAERLLAREYQELKQVIHAAINEANGMDVDALATASIATG